MSLQKTSVSVTVFPHGKDRVRTNTGPFRLEGIQHNDRASTVVGVSTDKGYLYNEREMLSLAIVDVDHAEPGTAVSIVWGEPEGSPNPEVERHTTTEVSATVAPAPYVEDRR